MNDTQAVAAEPIRRSVTVSKRPDEAFRLFTEQLGAWWPLTTHSYGGDSTAAATFEARPGGRVYERQHDGTEREWGAVTVWEPPARFVLAWHIARPTEVEVRFVPVEGGTRVDLEHRGWEHVTDRPLERHASYSTGWVAVLAQFEGAAAD